MASRSKQYRGYYFERAPHRSHDIPGWNIHTDLSEEPCCHHLFCGWAQNLESARALVDSFYEGTQIPDYESRELAEEALDRRGFK